MPTPKTYLSFSQMTTFEMSPEKYADRYLYGQKQRISRNIQYGSQFATGLEKDEATGDPILDLMASKIPKFELMDRPVEAVHGVEVLFERDQRTVRVPVLPNKPTDIPLLAIPDTAAPGYGKFKEYKTSTRKWTQKMADDSARKGQICFYNTAIWLTTGSLADDVELVNIPVAYDSDGRLYPTGEMLRFKVETTMADVIRMTKRIRGVWAGISELCEKELIQ